MDLKEIQELVLLPLIKIADAIVAKVIRDRSVENVTRYVWISFCNVCIFF
jgi:hypothetical protein